MVHEPSEHKSPPTFLRCIGSASVNLSCSRLPCSKSNTFSGVVETAKNTRNRMAINPPGRKQACVDIFEESHLFPQGPYRGMSFLEGT